MLTALNPKQRQIVDYLKALKAPVGFTEFTSKNFYIPEQPTPLIPLPHQSTIVEYMFNPAHGFNTMFYSTIKKSGKTAMAAAISRWIAETWGRGEIYAVANDMEQARGRAYQKIIDSIELDPAYNRGKRILPDRWKIIEKQAYHIPSGSVVRAISNDYQGEAGSNPILTVWTELWAYTSEASRRLWEELTPVPTRKRSVRFVETYAGFENESNLLKSFYKLLVEDGRRLTHDDIDWPYEDQPPIYVNERAHACAYWDTGIVARRMPWQTDEYYETQAATLRPEAFERLHLNNWTSSVGSFIPVEWWYANRNSTIRVPQSYTTNLVPGQVDNYPIVLGVDAAVSSDCCAISAVSRDPNNPNNPWVRFYNIWIPPKGGTMDLGLVEQYIKEICAKYNVVQVAYDAYQLHKLMTDLTQQGVAWCKPFSQGADRAIADKQLYDLIRDRRCPHDVGRDFDDQIRNAAAKATTDTDTKLRLVKKSQESKIDVVVSTSMAVSECLRLNLE